MNFYETIKNDSLIQPKTECPVSANNVEEHFVRKSRSRLQDVDFSETPWPSDITPEPPSSLPSEEPFTMEELEKVIKSLPTRKSPGEDGVRYEDIKLLDKQKLKVLLSIYNVCYLHRKIPKEWKN